MTTYPLGIIANPKGTAPDTLTPVAGPRRLLLVDDSADNRLLIRSYLRRASYLIDEATDGDAAFQKAIGDRYDLILMDLQMPLVDGLQATRMIREWELANDVPRTPIIVLTASALEEDVMRALAAGADAHVSKPITRAMLMEATRRFMPAPSSPHPSAANPPPLDCEDLFPADVLVDVVGLYLSARETVRSPRASDRISRVGRR